jgi:hydroxymethylpyrimidine pyrophosphatase-like HAD family hydrolase
MIKVLKQAFEALQYPLNTSHEGFDVDMAEFLSHRAITSLKQSIEDLEKQEPVVVVNGKRFYTLPQAQKPLLRREVLSIIDKQEAYKDKLLPMFYRDQVLDICRDIEAAHNIKE